MFISATRIRLRSPLSFFGFMRANEASVRQLVRAPGFLGAQELKTKGLSFWTLSAWESAEAMKAYRNSGAHKLAMQAAAKWGSESSFVHWSQDEMPTWQQAHAHMAARGRLVKLKGNAEPAPLSELPPITRTWGARIIKPAKAPAAERAGVL